MRRSSALLLMLLALTGCYQRKQYGELAARPAPRTIVAVEVTNPYGRGIDLYYGTQFLGVLPAYASGRYSVAPSTTRSPVYGRWTGRDTRRVNLSTGETVRYVYEDLGPDARPGGRRCTETVCT